MKKAIFTAICAMLGALSLVSLVSAGLIAYEPFDYTAGIAVSGQVDTYATGSPTWNTAGTANATASNQHQVRSGSLTGPSGFPASIGNSGIMMNADNTEYLRLNLPQQYVPPSSLYYSLLLNVPDVAGLTTAHSNLNANNDGIIAFNNATGASATRPNTWAGELVMRLGTTSTTYNLGVRSSTTAPATTYFSGDLTPGQTYLVVVRYTSGTTAGNSAGSSNDLWIDPASATFGVASAPSPDGSTVGTYSATASQDHVDSLLIGSGIAAGADPNQTYIDEIRVGDTWADVTSLTVPEPTSCGLVLIGCIGLFSFRRK